MSWVIAPAISEINQHSDLRVEYHQEKRGRRIVGLLFLVEPKKPEDEALISADSPEERLEKLLLSHGANAVTAEKYARRVADPGLIVTILARLPKIVERAERHPPPQKYILGAIQSELQQRRLFEDPPPRPRPDHAEVLDGQTSGR